MTRAVADAPAPLRSWQLRLVLLLAVQAALSAWLFRDNLRDGFAFVLGDTYDSSIQVAILEHWWNVVRGLARWDLTNYFHPHSGTLGYNDGYLLHGLLYALGRGAGADPYLATALVNMALKALLFFGVFLFGRRVLALPFGFAVAGAAIVELANGLTLHALHAQLLALAFVPWCGLVLVEAGSVLLRRDAPALAGWGALFALLFGAWALTSFYMLWFFCFFGLLVLLALALQAPANVRSALRDAGLRCWLALAASLALLGLALLPFLRLYLPKARETGMHGWGSAAMYLPSPADLLNIGPGNIVWGRAVERLHGAIHFPLEFSEKQMGFTPVLLLLALAACLWVVAQRRRLPLPAVALAGASLAMLVLALGIDGQSLWRGVFEVVPGAKAVRVVSRCMLFLALPLTLLAMLLLARWSAVQAAVRLPFAAALCLFLMVEQANVAAATSIDRHAAMRALDSVAAPPPACRVFYVEDLRPLGPGQGRVDYIYRHNVEAMLVAEYRGLPTVNGFSSFNPPDWEFADPHLENYAARVEKYRARHGIGHLCALDLQTRSWRLPR